MRQEQRQEPISSGGPVDRLRQREARDAANRWLARFAPLLDTSGAVSADACRARLDTVEALRAEAGTARDRLQSVAEAEDAPLLGTLDAAASQLDALETDLKRRLGALAPGDPEGMVDLEDVRARLADLAARREVADAVGGGTVRAAAGERLALTLSGPNWAAAGAAGIFAFGWLSFTTFHAFFMIGGMASAFGWGALGLLGFYGIFWAAGLAMAWGAVQSASTESLELEGRRLTLRRKFGPFTGSREHALGPDSRAFITHATASNRSVPHREIAVVDIDGKEVRFGKGASAHQQDAFVRRINAHLDVQPRRWSV